MMPSCFGCGRPEAAPMCERCDAMKGELEARRNGLSAVADIIRAHWLALPKYHYPEDEAP